MAVPNGQRGFRYRACAASSGQVIFILHDDIDVFGDFSGELQGVGQCLDVTRRAKTLCAQSKHFTATIGADFFGVRGRRKIDCDFCPGIDFLERDDVLVFDRGVWAA